MQGHRTLKYRTFHCFILGMVLLFLTGADLMGQDLVSPLIKTGLMHKFAQNVEWPLENEIDTFYIGIYGQDPELLSHFSLLESVKLKGKPISIRQFKHLSNISGIHVLYITRENNIEIQKITKQIEGNPTLMITDRIRNQDLVMINFLPLKEGKVNFEVNRANIMVANLKVTADLLLLGGTDTDVAGLYKESQQTLQELAQQYADLSDSLNRQSLKIKQQNQDIQWRNEELEIQNQVFAGMQKRIEEQQEIMDSSSTQLASVLNEVEKRQRTLDSKIELIRNQENEINTQRQEIENRNTILQEQEKEISKQEKKIEDQLSQLSNFADRVARQKMLLYIILVICFLIVCLVFLIYRSYRVKKNANQEIEAKNRELQQSHEEIQQANEEVLATNEALEEQKLELQYTLENLKRTQSQLIDSEKMASIGVLTAGIAHELNNPINFVSGNVNPLRRDIKDLFTLLGKYDDLIASRGLSKEFSEVKVLKDKLDYNFLIKEVAKLLEGIEEGAHRSSQIVKGLRSFSRLDEEKCQIYDIHEGIESSLILLHNKTKNRIAIHRDYEDFKELECYPSKFNQVIMNVLTNSIQAIEGKGDIHIQTISSDIGVKIIIKDNGRGMSPEVKKHIFDPFFTTKDVGKGTGLGLSISFGIIEQHKGKIDVISEPGKGTEFIIFLPKTQSE